MDPSLPQSLVRRQTELRRICERLGVRRLEIFGSATKEGQEPADLDFLVDLGDLPPREYSRAYFLLRDSLEALFERPVDLVTPHNLENPYFRQRVEQQKSLLYAA